MKGLSKSPKLYDLIVELPELEMEGKLIIHFIWIAVTRMIAEGTIFLSRGAVSTSNMALENFLRSLPLNQMAFALQRNLRSQVEDWLADDNWEFTDTKNWFHKVFTKPKGSWVWCPPLALGKITVELLCEVKHMYSESRHVFLCRTLMEQQWGRMLPRVADACFTFKRKSCLWNRALHKPLTIAFITPLLSSDPWKLSRHAHLSEWEHSLGNMRHSNTKVVRDYMRKLWVSS